MPNDAFAFFEDYRLALQAGEIDYVAAAYRLPLPVVRPDRTVIVTDAKVLRDEIVKIIDTWRWAGMAELRMENFRADGFDPGMHVVSLVWRPIDGSGEKITAIDVTYAVRRTLTGGRIAAVLAHNEERRRLPLLSGPAASLELAHDAGRRGAR